MVKIDSTSSKLFADSMIEINQRYMLTLIVCGVALVIIVFLIMRELSCWYWKINRIVDLLESIDSKLEVHNDVKREEVKPDISSVTSEIEITKKKESIDLWAKIKKVITKKYFLSDMFKRNKKIT